MLVEAIEFVGIQSMMRKVSFKKIALSFTVIVNLHCLFLTFYVAALCGW